MRFTSICGQLFLLVLNESKAEFGVSVAAKRCK